MKSRMNMALAVAALFAFAEPALADQSIGFYSPETISATALGSSEMIVHIPNETQTRAMTVAPVDVTNAPQVTTPPAAGQVLDMTGADGTLRACYAAGGMARQSQNLDYYCNYDVASSSSQQAESSPYITPQGIETGYEGTSSVEDPALLDCVGRGGSLIQLAGNQQFACAM